MKKLIASCVFVLFLLPLAKGQNGYTYLDAAGGFMIKKHRVAEFSYEWAGRYYTGNEIFIAYAFSPSSGLGFNGSDSIDADRPNNHNYLIGYAFKPLIARDKNIALNLRLSGSVGTDTDSFLGSLSAGLELNFFTRSGIIIMVREKNQMVFFADDQWRIGLLAGVKIPLKKD